VVKKDLLNILLVYPRYPDTFWSFKHALKLMSKKAFIPPLGLLTVAALLPKTWKLKLVNLNMETLKDEDIRWSDYVFLSAMEVQQASVEEVIGRVKTLGKKMVAGGPLFTLAPDRFQEIDHFVLHEAEATLPSFLRDLRKGEEKSLYNSAEWPDMKSSPNPEWALLDMSKYAVMNVQYSRGCPFDCEFCDIALLNGNKIRTKTATQVLSELEALYQKGWRSLVFFGDDNFIGKPHDLKGDLLPALIKWMEEKRYPFSFFTQATINLADDEELMELMIRAGFESVFVGIETPEEKSLYECHKSPNRHRDMLAAVKKMQRFGLEVSGGFIVGFDSDPPSIFEKQIDFIQRSGITTAMVGLLNAPRGTGLYQRLQQEGRLLGEWTGNNTDFSLNFIPRMGSQALLEGYKYILGYIYSPHYFYGRLVTFLRNFSPPKKREHRIQLRHIRTFLYAIWALGITGEERPYYWKGLLWTAFSRPHLLHQYVGLAIFGYHFRKVFQNEICKSEGLPRFVNWDEESGSSRLRGRL
jgi:radical SAM superfamily enzyme YgiQ (UPF0313 family)